MVATTRHETPVSNKRGSALGPHEMMLLHQWGRQLHEAFVTMPYQVGSTLTGNTYRDVDVRMLAPDWLCESELRCKTVNLAVTLWGKQVTALPIDFQFQPPDEFHSYGDRYRSALGILAQLNADKERERLCGASDASGPVD